MSELKALMRNRVSCCAKSGANGESKLWQSALDRIEELEKPSIFWEKENPEYSVLSPEESISEYMDSDTIGKVIEFTCAKELPNFKVKVLGDNEDGSINLEYL
jgi:hypothetical protein